MSGNLIHVNGSITKSVKLKKVEFKINHHTCVAEIIEPYAEYYGRLPYSLEPNSLFLFTKSFCKLNDALEVKDFCKETLGKDRKLDLATAILDFTDHYHYAIRVGDFPDYEHIECLQNCYNEHGIEFCKRVHLTQPVRATVFKQFELEQIEPGIYLDRMNQHKGYIITPYQIDFKLFRDFLVNIRNNVECELFDAVIGTIDINAETLNIIRIYSENLNIKQLNCIQGKFLKLLETEKLYV